jgi:hypothetical protein
MKIKRAWAVQSLVICVVFNAVLAGLIFLMADKILDGLNEWVSPFVKPGAPNLPDDICSALSNVGNFLMQLRQYLAPVLAAVTSSITLLLWFCLFRLGRRQIDRAGAESDSGQMAPPHIQK